MSLATFSRLPCEHTTKVAFDRFQFERAPRPVDTEYSAEGFQTTGLSYDDYRVMHVVKKEAAPQRKLETPWWVYNSIFLKELVTRAVEARAGIRRRQPIGHRDRLRLACKRRLLLKPQMVETLDKLCKEYVERKRLEGASAWLRKREIEIECIDTQLRFLGREHLMYLGVIYHYYHVGSDSVNTAEALSLKPPHVRNVCWRLNKVARQMETEGWRVGRKQNRRLKLDLGEATRKAVQHPITHVYGSVIQYQGEG